MYALSATKSSLLKFDVNHLWQVGRNAMKKYINNLTSVFSETKQKLVSLAGPRNIGIHWSAKICI